MVLDAWITPPATEVFSGASEISIGQVLESNAITLKIRTLPNKSIQTNIFITVMVADRPR